MSLHAELSPEALEKLKRQRRASSISSLIIAVLVIALVGLLLGLILLPQLVVETPVLVTYQSSAEELPDEPEQVKVKTKVRPPAPSAQMTRAIVSHSVSPVSVPVTDVEVDTPSLDFGTLDFGEGWGDSVGFDEGAVSGFGSVKRVKGTIGGHLYDFKQTADGKPVRGYDPKVPSHFTEPVNRLQRSKFSPSTLGKYYRAPQDLYLRYVAIPYSKASEGPKFFNAEKEVKPTGWIAHYRGRVTAPKDGTFRFVGAADDYLSVMVNRRFQLVAAWPGIYEEVLVRTANDRRPPVRKSPFGKTPLNYGDWFKVSKGEELDVAITLGERPGGWVGFLLMIEEKGAEYRKAKDGGPLLPPFVMGKLTEKDKQTLRGFKGWTFELENVPEFQAVQY